MQLGFDTETTGKYNDNLPASDTSQPRLVQIGAMLMEDDFSPRGHLNVMIKPEKFKIPEEASKIHGITTQDAAICGVSFEEFWPIFAAMCFKADTVLAYNVSFDLKILAVEVAHRGIRWPFKNKFKRIDVMKEIMYDVNLPPNPGYSTPKFPKLGEAYQHYFKRDLPGAHGALWDVIGTVSVYREFLKRQKQKETSNAKS